MEDWQLESLVAALLAGPRAPDIVDKFEFILAQLRARGGLRAIHEKAAGEQCKLDEAPGRPEPA